MLDKSLCFPFRFPEPHSKLGGLVTLEDNGLRLEFEDRFLLFPVEVVRTIPFSEILDVRVKLTKSWFKPKDVVIEVSTRSLRPLRGLPGHIREKLWLWTQKENLRSAQCLEQLLNLNLHLK